MVSSFLSDHEVDEETKKETKSEINYGLQPENSAPAPFEYRPQSAESTNAWRIYKLANRRKVARESANYDLPAASPVTTTSTYSRSDGIVAWQGSLQQPLSDNHQTETVEVLASHHCLGLNPCAWWTVTDRLPPLEGRKQAFERKGTFLHGLMYPNPVRAS